MAKVSPARSAALSLVSRRRRSDGRIRDMARSDKAMNELSTADRALAFRIALGTTAAVDQLDQLINARLKRPSSLEPRVRDALRVTAYELCYLDTPSAVAVSQGVELVRSVAPRAAGLANAVLRRLAKEARTQVDEARQRVDAGEASVADLALVSGLPTWIVERISSDRGPSYACSLCRAQLEPPLVYVATNGAVCEASSAERHLREAGMEPHAVEGLPGTFVLDGAAPLASSGLLASGKLVAADLSAQLVCRIAGPDRPGTLLEIGQGRGTKSILLAGGIDTVQPVRIVGVDSVPYKVDVASRRMAATNLESQVSCVAFDARGLSGEHLPKELDLHFDTVLLDAPCSGSGTMRRHPEIASALTPEDVSGLASLQIDLLCAAAARVAPGGTLVYATCSVLREEDEAIVEAFLGCEEGSAFHVEPVGEAPECMGNPVLAGLVKRCQTPEGYFLSQMAEGEGDGHFCVRLVRE